MNKHSLLVLFSLFMLMGTPASAGENCYSQAEAEAEQGIRIHSELMVIGLNCQHMGVRHGMNLYGQYRAFTNKHATLFGQYEKLLMDYFQRRGDSNPESSLITLRTDFANKISNDAATMRPDVFCSSYAPRIDQADKMDEKAIRVWASKIYDTHPVTQPLCKG